MTEDVQAELAIVAFAIVFWEKIAYSTSCLSISEDRPTFALAAMSSVMIT
jgi:hypothetical protein